MISYLVSAGLSAGVSNSGPQLQEPQHPPQDSFFSSVAGFSVWATGAASGAVSAAGAVWVGSSAWTEDSHAQESCSSSQQEQASCASSSWWQQGHSSTTSTAQVSFSAPFSTVTTTSSYTVSVLVSSGMSSPITPGTKSAGAVLARAASNAFSVGRRVTLRHLPSPSLAVVTNSLPSTAR